MLCYCAYIYMGSSLFYIHSLHSLNMTGQLNVFAANEPSTQFTFNLKLRSPKTTFGDWQRRDGKAKSTLEQ